jgi:hypothetical protein
MPAASRTIRSSICVCLAALAPAACGGGGAPSAPVAQVGSYAITEAMLDQWMKATVAEDYVVATGYEVPPRLVSEPHDYPACLASLKRLVPVAGLGPPQHVPTEAQLRRRCEQLYQTIKYQTLTYLVSAYWTLTFGAAHGIRVTEAEIQHALERIKAEQYPTERQFQQMLALKRRTLSQELFTLRVELLQERFLTRLSPRFERELKDAANSASCPAEYIVEHCKPPKVPARKSAYAGAPNILLTEIARWRPETARGLTGEPVT